MVSDAFLWMRTKEGPYGALSGDPQYHKAGEKEGEEVGNGHWIGRGSGDT